MGVDDLRCPVLVGGPETARAFRHQDAGRERVEAACLRALEIGARSYGSVRSILDNNLDRQAAAKRAADGPAILHANIRGPRYYN